MPPSKNTAAIRYKKSGNSVKVELIVPTGTRMKALLRALEVISVEVLPEIGPVGCAPCTSGGDLTIREGLERILPVDLSAANLPRNVLAVNLRSGKLTGRIG